ncbi:hypothetical protein ACQKNX_24610 [Lysinibacillus sp. NPDC093712]|uniref:hypothetical protein n=1 Tax=Lysinibacillus sp. NPDC093712 TaxID=3390579 RepID=UPI003CFCF7D4
MSYNRLENRIIGQTESKGGDFIMAAEDKKRAIVEGVKKMSEKYGYPTVPKKKKKKKKSE